MLRNPKIRLAIYAVAFLALIIVGALNMLKIIDGDTAASATTLINAVAQILGVGGVGTAAAALLRQLGNNTLAISGTPDQQLAQAAKQYADQVAQAKANVAQAQSALSSVVGVLPPELAGPATQAIGAGADIATAVLSNLKSAPANSSLSPEPSISSVTPLGSSDIDTTAPVTGCGDSLR